MSSVHSKDNNLTKNLFGTLYVVATPIGNLKDISFRAIEILNSVELILCEDTRLSKKLFDHYQIKNELTSYHTHNEAKQSVKAIEVLKSGKDIALVSDAGTPAINDPGSRLVNLAHQNNIQISPIAGASSLIASLSCAGIDGDFVFKGFIPQKTKQRLDFLTGVLNSNLTTVVFVGKSKITDTLNQICKLNPKQNIVLAKEISKIYETILKNEASEINKWLLSDLNHQKGEFVLIIEKNKDSNDEIKKITEAKEMIEYLLSEGLPASQCAKITSKIVGLAKKVCYKTALEISKK